QAGLRLRSRAPRYLALVPRSYTDDELDAATEALTSRDRFRDAEAVGTAAAPKLQRGLAEAPETGGWFGGADDTENRKAARVTGDELEPTHILISHGHADHMADAVGLAKRTGAPCVALVEVANWLGEQGVETVSDPNLGGTVEFDWGWVKLVQALHTNTLPGSEESPFSATTGVAVGLSAGLVINIGGTTVY